jgi:hypothetical protein
MYKLNIKRYKSWDFSGEATKEENIFKQKYSSENNSKPKRSYSSSKKVKGSEQQPEQFKNNKNMDLSPPMEESYQNRAERTEWRTHASFEANTKNHRNAVEGSAYKCFFSNPH